MEAYIEKALRGDHEAFERLYDAYAPSALRLAASVTLRADLAADAVQEAFLRVYRKGGGFRSGADFEPWFYRIVLNESRRAARCNPFPAEEGERAAFAEDTHLSMAVEEAFSRISPQHRAVLTLKFLLGYTEAETAKILRVPEGTVKSRIHYAKKELARILGEEVAL